MRLRLLALAVLLLPVAAQAQQPAANTFYAGPASGGAGPAGFRALVPADAAPLLANANTWTATQTINPPSGTLNQGVNVIQTGPSSVTSSGPTAFNNIAVTYTGGSSAAGSDAFGLLNSQSAAFRSNYSLGGSNLTGFLTNGLFAINNPQASTNAVVEISVLGSIYSNVSMNSNTTLEGLEGYVLCDTSCSTGFVVGTELDVGIAGSAAFRFGLYIDSFSNNQGATQDAAIGLIAQTVGFKNFALLSNLGGAFPIDPGGSLFSTNVTSPSTFTIGSILNFPTATVTGNILSFPNVAIAGSGAAVFGAGAASLPPAGELQVTGTSHGSASLITSANGASGLDYVNLTDSALGTSLVAGVYEASATFTRFGQTADDWGFVFATSASSNGLMVGSLTGKPLLLGTNNTLAAFINSSQQFSVGSSLSNTPASSVLFTISSQSGVASPSNNSAIGTIAQIVGANGNNAALELDTFANAGTPSNIVAGVVYGGTAASISATPSGAGAWALPGYAYDGSAIASGASLFMATTENWSSGHHGMSVQILATPNGSTTRAPVATYQAGVQIGAPTGGDEGSGTINVATAYYSNGTIGVSCNGTPTSSFAAVKGITTHC